MKNKKKSLKKINLNKESIFAKTLLCFCGCRGEGVTVTVERGYAGNAL